MPTAEMTRSDVTDDVVAPERPAEPPRSAGFRRVLLIVLVVALVASAGLTVWLLAERRGEARDLQDSREAAMAQAEQFALRMGTFGPDELDGQGHLTKYADLVRQVVTPKYAAAFDVNPASGQALSLDQVVAQLEPAVAKAKATSTAKVYATGVTVIDPDSATVLVAGVTQPGGPAFKGKAPGPQQFLWRVQLVHTEGRWLVDGVDRLQGDL